MVLLPQVSPLSAREPRGSFKEPRASLKVASAELGFDPPDPLRGSLKGADPGLDQPEFSASPRRASATRTRDASGLDSPDRRASLRASLGKRRSDLEKDSIQLSASFKVGAIADLGLAGPAAADVAAAGEEDLSWEEGRLEEEPQAFPGMVETNESAMEPEVVMNMNQFTESVTNQLDETEAANAAIDMLTARDMPEEIRSATGAIKKCLDSMGRKVQTSNEVIQQLKTVIRAQHLKIEELKDPSMKDNGLSPKLQMHLLREVGKHDEQAREEARKLQIQVRRLTNQVRELKSRNSDLQRVNRRHSDMLSQCGDETMELSTQLSQCTSTATLPESGSLDETLKGALCQACGGALPSRTPRRTGPRSQTARGDAAADEVSKLGSGPNSNEGTASQRMSLAARSAMALWHELEPRGILRGFLHSAARLSEQGRGLGLTLYVADPWLRSVMAEALNSDGAGVISNQLMKPTIFYLEGKVTVHAFRRDGVRAEAPRFANLASLPIMGSASVMALPLQAGPGRPVLAALQVTAVAPACASESGPAGVGVGEAGGGLALSASQVTGLQLLCNTAAGILDMRRRIECVKAIRGRARDCLSLAAQVNCAHNLGEFEGRAKILCTKFFNVANVRICFFDQERQELVTTTMRSHRRGEKEVVPSVAVVGRRNFMRHSVKEGIVGRCVRKQAVFHLDRVISSPFVSEAADGVDINGRNGEINMLAGPMVARFADGSSQVVGVLQLLEKQRRASDDPLGALEASGAELNASVGASASLKRAGPGGGGPLGSSSVCDPFTQEDEDFFAELLRILGLAVQRTAQVQQAGGIGKGMAGVERLLAAA